jgi:hypothetical protein
MEQVDIITAIFGFLTLIGGGIAGRFYTKIIFVLKVVQQAIETFNELKLSNAAIYTKVVNDPTKKELAKVLANGIDKIPGLKGIR